MSPFFTLLSSFFILFASCTREETLPYTPSTQTVEWPVEFDNIRAEIKGFDHQVVATVRFDYDGGNIALTQNLPEVIPADQLCRVARDSYNDYEGFWPARDCSDRTAKVAELGDIIAYNGDTKVGRLYPTSWEGDDPAEKAGAWFACFHYADRPFTLSGTNLTAPGGSVSFTYNASFQTGWNIYYRRYDRNRTLVTTTLPEGTPLYWRFEVWP